MLQPHHIKILKESVSSLSPAKTIATESVDNSPKQYFIHSGQIRLIHGTKGALPSLPGTQHSLIKIDVTNQPLRVISKDKIHFNQKIMGANKSNTDLQAVEVNMERPQSKLSLIKKIQKYPPVKDNSIL